MWASCRKAVVGAGAAVRSASTHSVRLSTASSGAASSALRPAVFGAGMQRRDVVGLFSSDRGRKTQFRFASSSTSDAEDASSPDGEDGADELSAEDAEELDDLGAEVAAAEEAEAAAADIKRPVLWRGRASDAVENDGDAPKEKEAWLYSLFDEEPLKKAGITKLSGHVFGAPVRLDILHRVVVWQRREWWQGTSRVKQRNEVRGGGKKPWKQKGTGRARVSSIRNPIWRGGGIVHGPKPRDHSIKLPKRIHQFALRVALSVKYAQGDLMIVEDLEMESFKTKGLSTAIKNNGLNPSTLFVDGYDLPTNFELAVRNIPKTAAVTVSDLIVYEMLLCHRLVLTVQAVELLEELLGAWRVQDKVYNLPLPTDELYLKEEAEEESA